MKKRLLTLLMALVVFVAAVPVAIPVSAAYENTHTNTGNQRYDIIQVALTQVGYKEGSNNYTKYGAYFNNPNTQWCGWFVSWCAAQAKVPSSVLRRQGIAKASSFGLSTFKASERTPQSGDLYFKSGHVGLVYSVSGNYFTTIEGNSNDQVEMETLSLYSSSYWFASPNYGGSNNSSHTHSLATAWETAHPHKEYQYCTSCDYKSYTGNVGYVADCTECIQENCSHEYSNWSSGGDSKHIKTCTKCGKEVSDSHDWVDVEVIKEATCAAKGSKTQECEICGATRTKSISKTNDHSYGDWTYNSDDTHSRTCAVCGKKVKEDHEIEMVEDENGEEVELWTRDETSHYQECIVCQQKIHEGEHEFGENCMDPCSICGYVRPEGHPYSEEWTSDETCHWRVCTLCGEGSLQEAHVYSAECDEDCDICGAVREVEHTYPETMETDETGHWYACSVCGKIHGFEAHTPGPEATEKYGQYCTVCQYELAEQIVHVHDYSPIEWDEQNHWGTCRCGDTLGPEPHAWDLHTGACSVCGLATTQQTQTRNWDFAWYIAGGVILGAGILAVSLMLRRDKKRKTPPL